MILEESDGIPSEFYSGICMEEFCVSISKFDKFDITSLFPIYPLLVKERKEFFI
jgi:hypothetical protein